VIAEEVEEGVIEPPVVPDLDRDPDGLVDRAEEPVERAQELARVLEVAPGEPRELQQKRPALAAERRRRGDELLEVASRVAELLLVGDDLRDLQREPEVVRRLRVPGCDGRFGRRPVERAVDLDGAEGLRVGPEIVRRSRVDRVERSPPVVVRPSAAAEDEMRHAGRPPVSS
jgi:hypothetical protein